jgi:hypothetical protein
MITLNDMALGQFLLVIPALDRVVALLADPTRLGPAVGGVVRPQFVSEPAEPVTVTR